MQLLAARDKLVFRREEFLLDRNIVDDLIQWDILRDPFQRQVVDGEVVGGDDFAIEGAKSDGG